MATRSTPALEGARVVVVGLGRTGQAAVRFLSSRGAQVTVSERRPRAVLEPAAAEAEALGATLEDSGHRAETFTGADLVVVSPGVPLVTPALAEARAAGVPVWAEVELAARFLRGALVGITGSNGKSTTTAWTAHLLQKAGLDATACGNIGVPLLSLVDTDDASRRYVVELSSFQLEGIQELRPQVAVVTNLTPDHQDRYQGFDDYIATKERIFCNQGPEDNAVLNADDDRSRDLACREGGPGRWLFSATGPVTRGAEVVEGELRLRLDDAVHNLLPASDLPLPGRHNVENALAATLAAHLGGAPVDSLAAALRSFRGLPHRMEKVAEADGVAWYNDSKATNLASTRCAVESLERPLILILGGQDKGANFGDLADLLPGRVHHVIAIGEARRTIASALEDAVSCSETEGLEDAVQTARALSRPGDAVLLAPACASFDAYRSFEERGDHFRALAREVSRG